jgi:hypothetical protein
MVSKMLIVAAVASLSFGGVAFADGLWNDTAPTYGGNSAVVSPNSMPPGFNDGTPQAYHAQAVEQWFASQGYPRFAENGSLQQPE